MMVFIRKAFAYFKLLLSFYLFLRILFVLNFLHFIYQVGHLLLVDTYYFHRYVIV